RLVHTGRTRRDRDDRRAVLVDELTNLLTLACDVVLSDGDLEVADKSGFRSLIGQPLELGLDRDAPGVALEAVGVAELPRAIDLREVGVGRLLDGARRALVLRLQDVGQGVDHLIDLRAALS